MATYTGPDGTLYPSKEYYNAQQTVKDSGKVATTEAIQTQSELDRIRGEAEGMATQIKTLDDKPIENETAVFSSPDPDTEEAGITDSLSREAANKAELKRIEEEARKDEAERARLQAEQAKKTALNKFMEGDTAGDKSDAEFEELGVDKKAYIDKLAKDSAEIDSLIGSYNDKLAQKDMAIAQIETRPGQSMAFMTRSKAMAEKQYNIELNQMSAGIKMKEASMARDKGNFAEAKSLVARAVELYTYDRKIEYDQIVATREENQDIIDDLGDDIKEGWEKAEELAKTIWEESVIETNFAVTSQIEFPGAGISPTDTKQEVAQKIEDWKIANPEAEDDAASTASIREFEYAVSQGYKGTFTDYQRDQGQFVESPANVVRTIIAGAITDEQFGTEYKTREELIEAIVLGNPTIARSIIEAEVYDMIRDDVAGKIDSGSSTSSIQIDGKPYAKWAADEAKKKNEEEQKEIERKLDEGVQKSIRELDINKLRNWKLKTFDFDNSFANDLFGESSLQINKQAK